MSSEEIFQIVKTLVGDQFAMDPEEISLDTSFEEDLGADTADLVELGMALEQEFEVDEIQEDELDGLKTVGDVVDHVAGKLNK